MLACKRYARWMGPQGTYIVGMGELAAYLDVSLSTILRWQRASQLPGPYRLGTTLVWRTEDIDRWWDLWVTAAGRG